MSRLRPVEGPTISLFPFLAVLLCTMGSLLVLLVLFSRSAKQAESAEAVAAREAAVAELEEQKQELAWRLEQLETVRTRTTEDLSRARMQLAGAEEDARRLADELDALEKALATVSAAAPGAETDTTILDRLSARMQTLRGTIDAHRADQAARPPAYAVVPYEGANGTHRRPLYIECCIDGVFLQPEGIRLKPSDFEGPPGPGNPLASALRAAREHIARTGASGAEPAAQPYPLLLVRPSGVMAYYAAREAIQSWGSEFGYQFIDEDWTLTYPSPDPALADVENRAVEESRRRLAWLQQVRPARPNKPAKTYRAATTRGGVVSSEGPSVLGDQSRWNWTDEQADGAPGSQPGGGGFGGGDGGSEAAATGSGTAGGAGGGPGRGFRAADGAEDLGGGDAVLGSGGGSAGGGMIAGNEAGVGHGSVGGGSGGSGGPGGDASGTAAGSRYAGPSRFYASEPEDSGPGSPFGRPGMAGGPDGMEGGAGPGGSTTGSAVAGATSGSDGGVNGAAGGGASSASSGAAGGSVGGTGNGASGGAGGQVSVPVPMPGLAGATGAGMAGGDASASASLAGKRGSNWASLATRDRPIPLRRPIRVECAADEFRILADGTTRIGTRIPIGARTVDSVDLLVQAVHAEVGRWGLAGNRMYWKPELVLSETADGRTRREDLERLLADSGIDTRTVGTPVQVQPLPPVERAALRSR